MAEPFGELDEASLTEDELDLKHSIEASFSRLETLFAELEKSDARSIPLPGGPLPTLSAPYELATIHALRALQLAEGAAQLLESANYPAVFPVNRALFETWLALSYAEIMFRRHVLEGNQWDRFNEKAVRLLQGKTSDPTGPKIISVGSMLDEVKRQVGEADSQATSQEEQAAKFLDSVYAELSDGTHPTMWSLAGHSEIREDRTGVRWRRRANPGLRSGPLFDLDLCLKFIIGATERLVETADGVKEAFREVPGADDKLRQAAAKVVETVLANPPELPDEARRVLEERGSALLEYWRSRRPE